MLIFLVSNISLDLVRIPPACTRRGIGSLQPSTHTRMHFLLGTHASGSDEREGDRGRKRERERREGERGRERGGENSRR